MNLSQPFDPWVAPLGWLALEAAVVILAALAVQPLLRTAAARRSLWRAALLASLAVLAAELSGTGSQLPAQLRLAWQTTFPAPAPPPEPPAPFIPPATEPLPIPNLLSPIPSEPLSEPLQFEPFAPLHPSPLPLSHSPTFPPAPSPWPALLWLTGLAALLARAAWTHAGFAWLRLRHFLPAAEALRDRVQTLAARLGLRRRVRVLASARLHAPAAFGWLRPGVGVPGDFTARFAPAQQDVMLAHELAHLAARDPLWQLLADLAVAALWWHPLAWVARHQHRLAAELAADDASQALPDGPVVLAECLLALGQEAAAAPRAPLGMAGFRSQLGRRVERLVTLPRRDWQTPTRLRLAMQTTTALLALATLALLPGCAANRSANEAPSELVTKWWQAKKSPAPVGDDVRSLHSKPERGTGSAETSQRLVTSSPTNTQPVLLQGRVSFNGTPLPEREIPLSPSVLAARTNAPLMTRFHRVSTNGGLADVLVYVKEGLANQTFDPPTNTHPTRIQGYEYQPYITAVQVGQPIRWESDVNLNFHPTPTNPANREFNFVLMPSLPVEATFTAPEFFLRTKDDVHPWLFGYVSVLPHPFFAVTDAEGRFRFPRPLPPGKYTLAAVHRRAGEVVQELDLTVPQPTSEPKELDFAFGRPATASQSPASPPPQAPQPPSPRPASVLSPPADFSPSKPPTRAELLERKAHVEAQLKETEKTFLPTHPKRVGLRKQLESIEEALKQPRPVGDDVRSLQSPQPQTPSQRLVTSSPTAGPAASNPRVIHLAGEFLTPGPLTIPDGVQPTLIATITRSGGLTPNGDLKRVKLVRGNPGLAAVEEVNVAAILSGSTPAADLPLTPGDTILVPALPPAVNVTGSVRKPGRLSFSNDEKLTAYAAILRAGGFAQGASLTNCYIVREVGNGEKARLPFNVKQIQQDPAKDIGLQAGDIVVIPSSRILTDAEKQHVRKLVAQIEELSARRRQQEEHLSREGKAPNDFRGAIDYDSLIEVLRKRILELELHGAPLAPDPKPGESAPTPPVGDDVRSLTPARNPERGTRNEEASQSLVTSSPTSVQLAAASPKGITLPVPNPYYKTNSQPPFLTHSSKGAQLINRKLDQIVLPEVHFDAVPLAEVMKRLDADAKKFDPEPDPKKKGLNFLINDVAPAAPLLDAAGNPVPVARPVALSEGLIRLNTTLRNLTLRQVLDVVCKTAELPTQYSVEEYAIAFIPRGPVAYYSRIFRVNPDTFIQGLQGVVATPVLGVTPGGNNAAGAAGQNQPATATPAAPARATVPATVPAAQRTAAEANALVRQFFQSAGVTALGATNGSTRVTFNPANGLLQVRGTTNDLRLIEQAIQKVQPPFPTPTNAAPPLAPKVIYKTNNSAPFLTHSSKGAQRINAKLDEIVLPEVHLDGLYLPEVLKWLDENVRRHDPEKKGVTFLINNVMSDFISANSQTGASGGAASAPAAKVLDPVTGQPIPAAAVVNPTPDLDNAFINVARPIKDLTLRQALDVICKTATLKMPDGRSVGLKYSIEEYAIVFSPKLPEKAAQFSRMFKVDPETFIEGLRTVVFDEKELKPGSRAALEQALREKAWTNSPTDIKQFTAGKPSLTNGVFSVVSTNLTGEINRLIRRYFTAAGVSNLGVTNGPDATQIFFNDRNGLLLVRASLEDLDIIQQAIELLNVKPPQVMIEAKFVEVNQNDSKALGFDWFLGNTLISPVTKAATNRVVVIDREGNYQLDGQARSLDQLVATLKEEYRENSNLSVRIRTPKNARLDHAMMLMERCSRLGITNVSFSTESNPGVERVPAPSPRAPSPTGIFPQLDSPDSTGAVTNKLVRTNGPTAATITGILTAQQFAVVLKALEQRAAATLVSLPKVTTPSGKQAVVELPAAAKAAGGFAKGLKLEVIPRVEANGYTISFAVKVTRDGKQVLESRATVWDAQTLMLGGLELPGAKPPRLMLFLTPTIVDATGRRVHAPGDEMPFIPPVP